DRHISPEALSFIRFHGCDKPRDIEALRAVELVLTTYATLAADHAGQRILYRMEWYRVVLDEAHWIRNSSSRQFRAASCLHTKRRWCLTGTPIQNKLEDLISLAQFLQLPPVPTKASFQKNILGPLSQGGLNFARPLRAYLEAYCLRRSEKCLTLPPSRQEDVTLQLSTRERHLYDLLLDETRRQIDSLVSEKDTVKCNKLFTAMMKMRMLCNSGTFSSAGLSVSSLGPQHREVGCERCSGMDEDSVMLMNGWLLCPDCGRPLCISSPLPGSVDGERGGEGDSCGDSNTIMNQAARIISTHTDSSSPSEFSTKLSAVVQNVHHSGPEAKRQANVLYCQIDGRVSHAERSARLRMFKEDPRVVVLLMSIGTGAVGLNLTVANRVHIVEPQWNPSVEE
ncbi:hypothetical protein K449DRAFT_454101, partial [Hypoxylon sp. EC38]